MRYRLFSIYLYTYLFATASAIGIFICAHTCTYMQKSRQVSNIQSMWAYKMAELVWSLPEFVAVVNKCLMLKNKLSCHSDVIIMTHQ